MAEYIERMPKCGECIHNGVCYMQEICNNVEEQLREFGCDNFKPTADVVEVVRCKECIHYYELEPVCLKIYSDGNVSADAWQERKPDDFCSYGEAKMDRKGEGE